MKVFRPSMTMQHHKTMDPGKSCRQISRARHKTDIHKNTGNTTDSERRSEQGDRTLTGNKKKRSTLHGKAEKTKPSKSGQGTHGHNDKKMEESHVKDRRQ